MFPIKLEAIEFSESPTKTATINALLAMEKFINQMAGAQMLNGDYTAMTPEMQLLLTAAVHVKKAEQAFSGQAGLPQPRV